MDKLLALGIDPWAMLLYLVNTGIVIIVLTYYLYKPILNFVDKRRDQILKNIDESKHLQETFEKKLEESEKKKSKMEAELKEEMSNLSKFTEAKKKELIAEMEASRISMIKKAQEEIEARKEGLMKEVEGEVKVLMAKIILDIVENKVPEDVIQESIGTSWKAARSAK